MEFLKVNFFSHDLNSEENLLLPVTSKDKKKVVARNGTYDYEGGYNKKMEANGPECYLSVNTQEEMDRSSHI